MSKHCVHIAELKASVPIFGCCRRHRPYILINMPISRIGSTRNRATKRKINGCNVDHEKIWNWNVYRMWLVVFSRILCLLVLELKYLFANIDLLMTVKLTIIFLVGLNLKSTLQMYTPASESLTLSKVNLAGSSWNLKNALPPKSLSLDQCIPCSSNLSLESNLKIEMRIRQK